MPLYEKSVELLQKAVADELMAIHQYMYFHFHCDDQGLELLAALFHRTAIEEMMHVERFAERIIFLKGDVDMKPSAPIKQVRDVKKMLKIATEIEEGSIKDYNDWAVDVGSDSVTRKLFEDVVADEERHFSQYDDERDNIARYGDGYLAQQVMDRARKAGQPGGGGPA